MAKLRTYAVLQTLASSLTQPFVNFLAALLGVDGIDLGIIATANTFFSSISQLALSSIKTSPKKLILLADVSVGILWYLMVAIGINYPAAYVGIYIAISCLSGMSTFGWLIVLERFSIGARGKRLAEYGFYSSIGGLIATLVTGLLVGSNYSNFAPVFLASGSIYLTNGLLTLRWEEVAEARPSKPSLPKVWKFLGITAAFNATWAFAWPLFPLAQVYVYHMNALQVGLTSVIAGCSTLILQRRIGALVDRYRKFMMFLGRLGLVTFPLAYALGTSVYDIYGAQIVSGFTGSISSTAYYSYLFDKVEDKRRGIAFYNAFSGVGALAGGILGGLMATLLAPLGQTFSLRLLLLSAALGRLAASTLYLFLDDARSSAPPPSRAEAVARHH
ncbi:MFS transporter [Sulfodiicoccus acidiphilus]|uniref:MFS transporter n=1 Tax=Sulfodiicoccus acidiphilus TaxID=1670455 RepID=A0A348B286_9CREN|nr:MFS transporter [Sulfodiicoccus acidiphilus]BBD72288.1 MFS transporter [Sulfodiicoccus acidiphilus]GGT90517.1 MFS transporter [Sulfodiicoccus acidiphilus]